jgi:hypothetical protein
VLRGFSNQASRETLGVFEGLHGRLGLFTTVFGAMSKFVRTVVYFRHSDRGPRYNATYVNHGCSACNHLYTP